MSGIKEGNRLPSVPERQGAAAVTHRWRVARSAAPFVSASVRHVGSRYTLIDDLSARFGSVNLKALPNTIGGPRTQNTFTFNPELPAYTLGEHEFQSVRRSRAL